MAVLTRHTNPRQIAFRGMAELYQCDCHKGRPGGRRGDYRKILFHLINAHDLDQKQAEEKLRSLKRNGDLCEI